MYVMDNYAWHSRRSSLFTSISFCDWFTIFNGTQFSGKRHLSSFIGGFISAAVFWSSLYCVNVCTILWCIWRALNDGGHFQTLTSVFCHLPRPEPVNAYLSGKHWLCLSRSQFNSLNRVFSNYWKSNVDIFVKCNASTVLLYLLKHNWYLYIVKSMQSHISKVNITSRWDSLKSNDCSSFYGPFYPDGIVRSCKTITWLLHTKGRHS